MKRRIKVERGTGNVFADIGIANPEQALAKAEIARQVNKLIQGRELSQSQAASILGIDQPRVSALSKGRLSVFSLEKMMEFASRMGNEVEISIKPSGHTGSIRVSGAGAGSFGQPPMSMAVGASSMAVAVQDFEFSFCLGSQLYGSDKGSIQLDPSQMFRFEKEAEVSDQCALVAA
jgi:predicted XRE-type DNA-binding protein